MPFLEVTQCPVALKQRRFPLKEGANTVGREKGCDIEIPDPRISGRHITVFLSGDQVEIVDQNSTNGTWVNGVRIRKAQWENGVTIALGGTEIKLDFPVLRKPQRPGMGAVANQAAPDSVDATLQSAPAPQGNTTAFLGLSNSSFDFSVVSQRSIQALDDGHAADEAESPKVQQLLKRMQVFRQMLASLNAALDTDTLLDRVMTTLFEVVQCDTGYCLLIDEKHGEAVNAHLAYERGRRKENLDEKLYSRTLVRKVIESKAGFLFDSEDAAGTAGFGGADASLSIFQLRIKTALCCPIHSEGRVFGVIYLDSKRRGSKFTTDDLDLALGVAGLAGIAIENLELVRKLRTESAIRDHLKRFLSPNLADRIIAERGEGGFHLTSQKAQITVLFADIRGFTPLSEKLAPMAVAQLLNTYFSEMCTIVFANGGTLDKFIGDCMMVLFNAPIAVIDHEAMAVKTAVEMRRRLLTILPKWRAAGLPDFHVGIGIASGEAVVGSIGTESRMEYTAIGDTVNIASRLCGIARPDQILCTESVCVRVRDRFRTVMLGATQLKGKSAQVLVHEVVDDLVMPG
jgi:adenylate cyclase